VISRIEHNFEQIVEKIDYEPIFADNGTVERDGPTLFAEFPNNDKTQRHLQSLVRTLANHDITDIGEDLLDELYQELIPPDERKELGQYYTPPSFAEAIARWAVNEHHEQSPHTLPKAIDPASGSGTFPVELYSELDALYDATHEELLDESLHFAEINRFPLHLTALNLASQSPSEPTENINDYHASFFDDLHDLDEADIIVGNPPYISSRNLHPDKDHFRNHLEDVYSGRYGDNGKVSLSKRSDAFVYFLTKSISLLKKGGLFGFLIPTKWMTANYGAGVKQLLHETTKLHHIVTYSKRAFEDAEVTTCLLLVEKCSDDLERAENITQFTHLKEQLTPEDLYHNLVSPPPELDGDFGLDSRSGYRTIAVKQDALFESPDEKIEYYARTPGPAIKNIIRGNSTVMLRDIASVCSGIKTGSNGFFILDKDDIQLHNLDVEDLKPAMTSLDDEEGDKWMLLVDDLLPEEITDSTKAKQHLREIGYENLVQYIEHGEEQSMNSGRTCKSRDIWFQIETSPNHRVILPKGTHEEVGAIDNNERLYPKNRFYLLEDSEYDDEFLLALLTSSIVKISCESIGRHSGGGNLEIPGSDWKQVRVPNPELFTGDARQAVVAAFENGHYSKMNEIIIGAMGIKGSVDQYEKMFRGMRDARIGRGEESSLMLGSIEEY